MMRMRLRWTVAILIAMCLEHVATGGELWPDSVRLQGNWKVEEVQQDGKVLGQKGGYTSVTIGSKRVTFQHVMDEARSFVYYTDPFRHPKHFDLYDEQGMERIETGIYELSGDVLKLCRGDPRPTEFRTKPNDARLLFILKREREQGTGVKVPGPNILPPAR
jgi:uncharacterized protein (TIGR03067 family)